jgi:hypothetical protein
MVRSGSMTSTIAIWGGGRLQYPDRNLNYVGPESEQWSDEELAALALGADPNAPLGPDAVEWRAAILHRPGLLPDWYMPTPVATRRGGWPRTVILIVIIGFLIIDGFGLCVTSGFLSLP